MRDTYHDGTLVTMVDVEVAELFERIVADDIAVEDEEGAVVLGEDLACQGKRTGRAKRLGLHRKGNGDIIDLFVFLERGHHHLRPIVDGQHDISDASLR